MVRTKRSISSPSGSPEEKKFRNVGTVPKLNIIKTTSERRKGEQKLSNEYILSVREVEYEGRRFDSAILTRKEKGERARFDFHFSPSILENLGRAALWFATPFPIEASDVDKNNNEHQSTSTPAPVLPSGEDEEEAEEGEITSD